MEAFVTVVTTMDGPDLLSIAKTRLAEAEKGGFDAVVQSNNRWWQAFYNQRENGRVFSGVSGTACSDSIRNIYQSWTDSHGGSTKTDMRQLECSASYALLDRDLQDFDSMPCYNEIFSTSIFVRNWGDNQDMWETDCGILDARRAAKCPGPLSHAGHVVDARIPAAGETGRVVHTCIALELCLGTMAELIRPAWDEWDYSRDTNFLRRELYPMMKQMALFYAAYAKKGSDGYYHVTPSMEEERWGIYPEFSHNKDVISSLCLFRWALTRAADAAELLGEDAELRQQWREVAAHILPNPTWNATNGLIFAELPGFEPRRLSRDHQNEVNSYPTTLADEVNLDSPQDVKDMMLRTVRRTPRASAGEALTLLGVAAEPGARSRGGGGGGGGGGNGGDARRSTAAAGAFICFRRYCPHRNWPSAIFQARGGFLVSACKNANGVYYVEIQSRRDSRVN